MKRLLSPTLFAFVILAAASAGRGQTSPPQVQPPPPPRPLATPQALDPGRLEGGVYSNDFFGLSFAVPRGWVAQDIATQKAIMEEGKTALGQGATERKKAQLDAAAARTVTLLSASKYDPRTPAPDFNAMLQCVAERVPTAIVKTGADYLTLSLRTMQGTAAKVEMVGPVRTEKVGGVTFAAADIKMSLGAAAAAQKYYAALMKGYALVLIYSYVDEADAKTFEEVLKSVRFK